MAATFNHKFLQLTLLTILGCFSQNAETANILFFLPFGSTSHVHAITPLMEHLSSRGHNVTFLTMIQPKSPFKHKINVFYMKQLEDLFESFRPNSFAMMDFNLGTALSMFRWMINDFCIGLLTDDQFRHIASDKATKYDVIIMDNLISECGLSIVPMLGSPSLIYYCTTTLYDWTAMALDIPVPFSYVTSTFLPQNNHMSFTERMANSFSHLGYLAFRKFYVFPNTNNLVQKYYPGFPRMEDVEQNVSLVLANSHSPSLDRIRPTAPFLIEVGGTHCRPAKKLEKNLEEFFNASGSNGFIYFSLGTNIKSNDMTMDNIQTFLKAFGRLNQTVLWKFESKLTNLPVNVRITEWAPQQDILGHPNLKLFITHAGQLSTQEAIYHGVPVLGLPVGFDQVINLESGISKGFARGLNYANLTEDSIFSNIIEMIQNSRYKRKAEYYSALMRDRPQEPLEVATYWVEFIIRHQSRALKNLRFNGAKNLNFFQYFMLDIITLVCVILAITTFLAAKILKLILRFIWPSKKSILKQKTN